VRTVGGSLGGWLRLLCSWPQTAARVESDGDAPPAPVDDAVSVPPPREGTPTDAECVRDEETVQVVAWLLTSLKVLATLCVTAADDAELVALAVEREKRAWRRAADSMWV
jgi:hypothetical protein